MEKFCVGHAYAWNCQPVCLGSLVTAGPDGARLIRMIDATSAGTGGTMHMTATVTARGVAVVAADPGPDQGPGDEGIAHDLAVAAVKGGTAPHLTPGAVAGLALLHGPSLGLLCGGHALTHGLHHAPVAVHRLVPDPGLVLRVLRETAAPVPPARKRAQPQERTDGDKQTIHPIPHIHPHLPLSTPQNMSSVNFIVLLFFSLLVLEILFLKQNTNCICT